MDTTKKIIIGMGIATIVGFLALGVKKAFTRITDNQKFRGSDAYGSGAFGSSRSGGTRKHAGVDVLATPGQFIYAPIDGKVIRIAMPYADDQRYKGLVIQNDQYEVKMFYISPTVPIGITIKAGQPIAVAQNISAKHGAAMMNHVHFEVRDKNGKLLNPTKMFV